MSEFDRGPSAQLAQLFDRLPDPPVRSDFWFDWGPVFYRGRLDGSARVLCIASDPGPTERIAGRSLVGNAGQRVRGLWSGRPDDDGDATGPIYGSSFRESDHAAIPRRDLPFGAPAFLGDDAWVRASGRAQNSVRRPSDDDEHTPIWNAPRTDA